MKLENIHVKLAEPYEVQEAVRATKPKLRIHDDRIDRQLLLVNQTYAFGSVEDALQACVNTPMPGTFSTSVDGEKLRMRTDTFLNYRKQELTDKLNSPQAKFFEYRVFDPNLRSYFSPENKFENKLILHFKKIKDSFVLDECMGSVLYLDHLGIDNGYQPAASSVRYLFGVAHKDTKLIGKDHTPLQ